MANRQQFSDPTAMTYIRASGGLRGANLRELWQYRDLFYLLVWRDIKVRYVQSVLGMGWAVIQPVSMMIVFTIVFGRLAKIESDGSPYAIFSYTALVPWTYFSSALTQATGSLVQNSNILSKVYFPRLIMPLSATFAKLIDFSIAMLLIFGLMAWFRITPNILLVMLPVLILIMIVTAAGLGIGLTAMGIRFRDIKYGIGFAVRILMYASPVVYPASLIPDQYRIWYGLNPMVGVIEGFRSAFLGINPMPWDLIAVGSGVAIVIFISGTFYFRRMERIFADVV